MNDTAIRHRNGERVLRELSRSRAVPLDRLRSRHRNPDAVRARQAAMWVLAEAGWVKRDASYFLGLTANGASVAIQRLKARGVSMDELRPLVDVATGAGSIALAVDLVYETLPVRWEERVVIAEYLAHACAGRPLRTTGVYGILLLGGNPPLRLEVLSLLYAASLDAWVPVVKQQIRAYGRKVA